MAGMHYADALRIRVGGYDGYPLPGNLREAWLMEWQPGEEVDREEVLSAVQEILGPEPHTIDDSLRITNWGASGAILEIAVSVSAIAGGVHALVALIEKAVARVTRIQKQEFNVDDDEAVGLLARDRGCPSPRRNSMTAVPPLRPLALPACETISPDRRRNRREGNRTARPWRRP
jgi:hypothetical protein